METKITVTLCNELVFEVVSVLQRQGSGLVVAIFKVTLVHQHTKQKDELVCHQFSIEWGQVVSYMPSVCDNVRMKSVTLTKNWKSAG